VLVNAGEEENGAVPARSLLPRAQFGDQELMADYIRQHGLAVTSTRTGAQVELQLARDGDWYYTYRFRLQAGCWQLWQAETPAQ